VFPPAQGRGDYASPAQGGEAFGDVAVRPGVGLAESPGDLLVAVALRPEGEGGALVGGEARAHHRAEQSSDVGPIEAGGQVGVVVAFGQVVGGSLAPAVACASVDLVLGGGVEPAEDVRPGGLLLDELEPGELGDVAGVVLAEAKSVADEVDELAVRSWNSSCSSPCGGCCIGAALLGVAPPRAGPVPPTRTRQGAKLGWPGLARALARAAP
jgi:hypothetical protein